MFNSIFGAFGQALVTGQGQYQVNPQDLLNSGLNSQAANNMLSAPAGYLSNAQASSQMAAYNQRMYSGLNNQHLSKWVFNGKECSLEKFAEHVFPEDEQARMLFVLKHAGT